MSDALQLDLLGITVLLMVILVNLVSIAKNLGRTQPSPRPDSTQTLADKLDLLTRIVEDNGAIFRDLWYQRERQERIISQAGGLEKP